MLVEKTVEETLEKEIKNIKVNITHIEKELENPDLNNRSQKLNSIKYGEEMILNLEKFLKERAENGQEQHS